ncbi:MAG: hypothetical protein WEC14_07530 [Chloroflexota bacterium]
MTPDRTWDPLRFQRGTRGFAAFVTALNAFIVLGVAAVVAPASGLPETAMAWVVILGLVGGISHLVAVVGLVRARAWARSLVAYLAAGGIGVAVFSLLMTWRAGEPMLGAGGETAVGFFIWMVGAWAVAARFTLKAYAWRVARPRPVAVTPTPAPAVRTSRPVIRLVSTAA